ncbi:MAG: hypothetical protein J6S67_26495 [Methanobrevibacter sp.]|nr:hypothetical protein [Methanobrevibacter sp.]
MKTVEMKKNFKTKSGYFRILMWEKGYGDKIKFETALVYPSDKEGKFIKYVQNTGELTRAEANKWFLDSKKQGYTYTIEK